ncbi:MAG: type II secretion system protein [Patescibacteria group bacterium]|jgi:type II secretory pathway pseudopilin PulG
MKKGTTIIELVVALGIIITGLLTVVGLIVRSIDVGTRSKNEIVALGFAQEGIEAVRAIRDSNSLAIEADDGAVSEWNENLFDTEPGDVFDYTGVPVVDYDYDTFPGNVVDGPWTIDFKVDSITDNSAQIMQHLTGDFTGLFFQDFTQTPDGVTISSTEFSRLITLEPICGTGNYLTHELGHEAEDLSASGGCPVGNEQIGIHIISVVTWLGKNNVTEDITLTHDMYDWR